MSAAPGTGNSATVRTAERTCLPELAAGRRLRAANIHAVMKHSVTSTGCVPRRYLQGLGNGTQIVIMHLR